MKICIACGMPLENIEDIGTQNGEEIFCKYCVNEDKSVKTCEEVFNGGVNFFLTTLPELDKSLAERAVRKNMNLLPYWKNKDNECLKGEEVSDEEFQMIMSKLG